MRRQSLRRSLLAAVCVLTLSSSAQAQPAVTVTGDCNVTVVTTGSGSSRLDLRGHVCRSEDDPQRALRVMYYWLDPLSASFLLSSRIEASLRTILGDAPIILPNDVLKDARDLVERFGSATDANTTLFGDYMQVSIRSGNRLLATNQVRRDAIPKSLLRGLKVYDARSSIEVPDIDALQASITSDRWPTNYASLYCPPRQEAEWSSDSIASSLFLWRFAMRSDLADYRNSVRRLIAWLRAQNHAVLWNPTPTEEDTVMRGARAVEAMLYVARDGWPTDFLTIYGNVAECGEALGFLIYPREPYLQIAVLENVSTRNAIPLSSVRVQQSRRTGLRVEDADTAWSETTLPFPPGILRAGERLVIPLRIDFRRHGTEVQMIANQYAPQRAQRAYEFIRRHPRIKVAQRDGLPIFWKNSSAFTPNSEPQIKSNYVYGNRLALVSATAERSEIPLRPYDPTRVFMVAQFESGSCPFLYARYGDGADALKIGRMLRFAHSPERADVYERSFDNTLTELVIAEEELETTHLEYVRLAARDPDGSIVDEVTLEDVRLEPGQSLSVRPRVRVGVGRYELAVKGYYVPLRSQISSAAVSR